MVNDRRIFGERLQRHRERRGITLEQISRTTKVPAALFAGLERGDCSRWPAGIYARAYIRSYAEAIGLNGDEAVEDFTAAFAGAIKGDGIAAATPVHSPVRGALRLSLVEESAITPQRVIRRAALASVDLLIGFLIAAIAYVGLGANVWFTVAGALAYHAAGRLVSDDPLLYWLYLRARSAPAPEPVEAAPAPDNVPVGGAARTTA